jgi:sialate O-acetylesterase
VKLSPEVIATSVSGDNIQLTLDQPIQEGELYTFEVAGDDKVFRNVKATGKGNVITLLVTGNTTPRAIRYAWKDNPITANVRSMSGLPMSSFELKIK